MASLFSLPRSARIRKQAHFQAVFDQAKKVEGAGLRMLFVPVSHAKAVGVVAGKKIGNAVTRAACKRRLREVYRLTQNNIVENVDIILMAKSRLLNQSFHQTKQDFQTILVRAGLWKSEQ